MTRGLIAIDLATDSVVWRKNVGKYADSFWVTPDSKRIWMPLRGEIDWKVLDAADPQSEASTPSAASVMTSTQSRTSGPTTRGWIRPAGVSTWKSSRCRTSTWPTREPMQCSERSARSAKEFARSPSPTMRDSSTSRLDHVRHRWALRVSRWRSSDRHANQAGRRADPDEREADRGRLRAGEGGAGRASVTGGRGMGDGGNCSELSSPISLTPPPFSYRARVAREQCGHTNDRVQRHNRRPSADIAAQRDAFPPTDLSGNRSHRPQL